MKRWLVGAADCWWRSWNIIESLSIGGQRSQSFSGASTLFFQYRSSELLMAVSWQSNESVVRQSRSGQG